MNNHYTVVPSGYHVLCLENLLAQIKGRTQVLYTQMNRITIDLAT